jgi:hypothetical protein
VIAMKSLGGGKIVSDTGFTPRECRTYALTLPVSTLAVGVTSMAELEQDVGIARDFQPLSEEAMRELEARAEPEAGDGRHELFKSTQVNDGPHHRRQHGFALD